ncbi:hypothetical protein IGI04_013174 [Brassica rapa subsp. trilocularis]|uniref:Replication factor A C-terminal domain-containing protein n=1 Tax=Brassica rapa subsp. trilocularis TaxID=1813537 RepID=A0ABQ7N829_BRACM|nr:hypothetical protein IGI04_029035 [Brassica rapa subsp. trilocularis]KAG5393728.1 hypothetical protein IGI04_023691 [Brassica rapa subsp. trilocularis]KAG5407055.1 hypothetical protein IGI04_013174 [Brassica rapa subsp. trilocularis]
MSSIGKSTFASDSNSEKPKGVEADSLPGPIKPIGAPYVSSGLTIGDPHSKTAKGQTSVSSGLTKPIGKNLNGTIIHTTKTGVSSGVRGKAAVSSGVKGKAIVSDVGEVMAFKDVKFGPNQGELRFRLIHFWEARNVLTKVIIGLEMLLIDQEETVIQGFIPAGRIETYLPHMEAGGIYRLNSFYGSKNKTLYRVADPSVTITFSSTSVLSDLEDSLVCIPEDRFRFRGYEEFDAACDLKGDLYDYVGHIKLVNGQVLSDSIVIDDAEIASSRRVLLHVQTHDGPVMKLYLWDKAAFDFSGKIKASGGTARVILVTTLNPKRFGGALTLSTMTSSRVFLDSDVQATRDYLTWLNSNLAVANRVDADVVTKTETVTIGELFSFMKQEAAKVAWFECIATIGDVAHGSAWYYIGCGVCHTKATKGPTTLMCKKCGKSDIVGVAQYLARISVYYNDDHASFVLLGDAGQELTGKKASELVESYFEANEDVGDDHLVPVPQALIDSIGQTHKFIVKVSNHNLTGKTQSLTVTKVLTPEVPELQGNLVGNVILPDAHEPLQKGVAEDGPSTRFEESDGQGVKRTADNVEAEDPKRAKCG